MNRCFWCSILLSRKKMCYELDKRTRDHVIPQAYGGRDANPDGSSNIVFSCLACNLERSNEMIEDWKRWGKESQICRNKWRLTTATREKQRLLQKWGGTRAIKTKRQEDITRQNA